MPPPYPPDAAYPPMPMPSPGWPSWEFLAEASYAPLLSWVIVAARAWALWTCNREDIVPLATLFGGGIGIYYLAIRTRAADRIARSAMEQAETAAKRHEEQTTADRGRRITESFAKAIDQLGSGNLATRIGGIYTLERVAGESEREYWPIMETLTAFVRERAPWRPDAGAEPPAEWPKRPPIRPPTDIQAALTVLGRRDKTAPEQYGEELAAERRLDFVSTDLRGAQLSGARLESANLQDAHLEYANLRRAHLEGADLWDAHLESADLGGAHLEHANLSEAHLEHANLQEARLKGAILRMAHLKDADLWDAVGLTQEQLNRAYGDRNTTLPWENLKRPAHWPDNAWPEEPDNAQ